MYTEAGGEVKLQNGISVAIKSGDKVVMVRLTFQMVVM